MKEFTRGEEAARGIRNGRMARSASIDISGLIKREDVRESTMGRITIRIADGRNGEDSSKMMREERV